MGGRRKALALAILAIGTGAGLGNAYIGRLPNHAGYWLVSYEDRPRASQAPPRHTAFVVVDGLRRDAAETMGVVRELERQGQCRVSDQGDYTVSRPVYALLSTGLEVDRSGSRNNELTTPLFAESIWEVARQAGRRVHGSSHLPWFAQLFPAGFDRFTTHDAHAENVFEGEPLADVDVFHPLYVDEAGHQSGGASRAYADAVARADGEISGLLRRLDLERDLVVLTADHGHLDAGGHGDGEPQIRDVLLCVAGAHVRRAEGRRRFDGRATAPLLATLLGLRFPRHLRAGDDGLDAIAEIADVEPAWLADRQRAIDAARATNRATLETWLGGAPGTWPRWYDSRARLQWLRLGLVAAIAAVIAYRLRASWRVFAFAAVTWLVHRAILGPFLYGVINLKSRFVPRAFAIVIASAILGAALSRRHFAADARTWLVLLLVANVGHVFVYGWPLGFPLPPPTARYFPFFGAFALVGWGLAYLIAASRRAPRGSSPPLDPPG